MGIADITPAQNKTSARKNNFFLTHFIIFITDCFVCAVIPNGITIAGSKAPNISALVVTLATDMDDSRI